MSAQNHYERSTINYRSIFDYYTFKFKPWKHFITPLAKTSGVLFLLTLVAGLFSESFQGLCLGLTVLTAIGCGTCVYLHWQDQETFKKIVQTFHAEVDETIRTEQSIDLAAKGDSEDNDVAPFFSFAAAEYELPDPNNSSQRTVWGNTSDRDTTDPDARLFSTFRMCALYSVKGWLYGSEIVFDLRHSYREQIASYQWPAKDVSISSQTISTPDGGTALALALVVSNGGNTWTMNQPNTPASSAHIAALQKFVRDARN